MGEGEGGRSEGVIDLIYNVFLTKYFRHKMFPKIIFPTESFSDKKLFPIKNVSKMFRRNKVFCIVPSRKTRKRCLQEYTFLIQFQSLTIFVRFV